MQTTRNDIGWRRWLTQLFDQQMWCFGCDIVRPEGNLLLQLGMCRYAAPNDTSGSTMYTAKIDDEGAVFLWGFGVLLTIPHHGGLFLRRFDFAPRFCARDDGFGIHHPDQLGPLRWPVKASEWICWREQVARLTRWFGRYEHWIAETYGHAYRKQCLHARGSNSLVPAEQMAKEWERAACKCLRNKLDPLTRTSMWTKSLDLVLWPRSTSTINSRWQPHRKGPSR